MRYLLIILLFASCSAQKKLAKDLYKAEKTFDANRTEAAKYCGSRFPLVPSVEVRTDSAGYDETVKQLTNFSDSILTEVESKNREIDALHAYIGKVQRSGQYSDQMIDELQRKADAVKPVDVAALRASIEKELRAKIKPCKDSLIKIPDTRKAEIAQAEAKAMESERDIAQARILELEDDITAKNKRFWWLLVYAAGMTVFAFRKPIFSFLKTFV